MGGGLGKQGDAKRKVRFPKTGPRGEPVLEGLCTLCTNPVRRLKYQKDSEALGDKMQAIIDYNEDDCLTMRLVKDWLQERTVT